MTAEGALVHACIFTGSCPILIVADAEVFEPSRVRAPAAEGLKAGTDF
jgi:hypothetical protein